MSRRKGLSLLLLIMCLASAQNARLISLNFSLLSLTSNVYDIFLEHIFSMLKIVPCTIPLTYFRHLLYLGSLRIPFSTFTRDPMHFIETESYYLSGPALSQTHTHTHIQIQVVTSYSSPFVYPVQTYWNWSNHRVGNASKLHQHLHESLTPTITPYTKIASLRRVGHLN